MAANLYTQVDLLTMVSVFGLVLTVWIGIVMVWSMSRHSRDQKLLRRLRSPLGQAEGSHMLRLWHDGKEAVTVVADATRQLSMAQRWRRMCRDADMTMKPGSAMVLTITLTAAAFGVTLYFAQFVPWAALAALAMLGILRLIVRRKIAKHAARFEQQFLDALDTASRSLRAGHPLTGAFRLISEEVPAPVGNVFGEICQKQELGISLEDALKRAAADSYSEDLKLFATSVTIHIRTGGNLADMMERLGVVVRDRIRVGRRIRVLTAQTQFSKRILVALPLLLFVVLNILNPHYMRPLYAEPTGRLLLGLAAAGVLLGMWVMGRVTILRY